MPVLVFQSSSGKERVCCFTIHLIAILLLFGCLHSVSLPHGAMIWSMIVAILGHAHFFVFVFVAIRFFYQQLLGNIVRMFQVSTNNFCYLPRNNHCKFK